MIKSKRLQAICSYLTESDSIIDIGCDHAYVLIEMASRGCKKLLATDIHEGALKIAQKNILESGFSILCQQSDGLHKVDVLGYNTLVIAGMGESTIEHILMEKEKLVSIEKIILQSNNDLKQLRIFIESIGFFIENEVVVFEAGHFYTIMLCKRGSRGLSSKELEFGIFKKENMSYYTYLNDTYHSILNKIPEIGRAHV